MSWAHDYWTDRAELESLGLWPVTIATRAPRPRVKGESLDSLRRRILTLDELGASISAIARAVGRHRATVRYHLRECGVFKEEQ